MYIQDIYNIAKNGNPDLAIESLRPFLTNQENRIQNIFTLAYCYELKKEYPLARYLYSYVIKFEPTNQEYTANYKRCDDLYNKSINDARSLKNGILYILIGVLLILFGVVCFASLFWESFASLIVEIVDINTPHYLLPLVIASIVFAFFGVSFIFFGLIKYYKKTRMVKSAIGPNFSDSNHIICWSCGLARTKKFIPCPICMASRLTPDEKTANQRKYASLLLYARIGLVAIICIIVYAEIKYKISKKIKIKNNTDKEHIFAPSQEPSHASKVKNYNVNNKDKPKLAETPYQNPDNALLKGDLEKIESLLDNLSKISESVDSEKEDFIYKGMNPDKILDKLIILQNKNAKYTVDQVMENAVLTPFYSFHINIKDFEKKIGASILNTVDEGGDFWLIVALKDGAVRVRVDESDYDNGKFTTISDGVTPFIERVGPTIEESSGSAKMSISELKGKIVRSYYIKDKKVFLKEVGPIIGISSYGVDEYALIVKCTDGLALVTVDHASYDMKGKVWIKKVEKNKIF